MHTRSFLVVTFTAVLLAACGVSAPVSDTDSSAQVGSELLNAPLDTSHPFDVGLCQGPLNQDPAVGPVGTCRKGTARCSGTLIAPNLVLTARHCVAGASFGPNAATDPCDGEYTTDVVLKGGTHVTTSSSVYVGTPKWYEVTDILVPATNRFCADDIALLILDSNVPKDEARYVGVDLDRDIIDTRVKNTAIVGRGGIDETFALDENGDWTGGDTVVKGDLQRRIQEDIPLTCVSNGPVACTQVDHEVPTTHVYTADLGQFLLGSGAVSGDSGAGVFDQRGFKAFHGRYASVIGVATWNYIGPDGKPNGTGAQRLNQFAPFLRDGAQKAKDKGGYHRVWWVNEHAQPEGD